jgi:hypothetical protein
MTEPASAAESRFGEALLDPQAPLPCTIVGPAGKKAERRFAVYRNNVMTSLIDALGEIFPTLRNLVGEDFFAATAAVYVRRHPPTSPLLFAYGSDFADFIADFEPARDFPFLADVARLERLWLDCFHEADAPVLDPADLGRIPSEHLAEIRFAPHPAIRVARFEYRAVSILTRDRNGQSLEGFDPMAPELALLTRPDCDVEIRHLDAAGAAFVEALANGAALGEAAGMAMAQDPCFPLAEAIQGMLQAGCFTSLSTSARSEP